MGISFGLLAALALGAAAADPPTEPWTPATTNWNKLPSVAVPPVPTPPPSRPASHEPPQPGRVVTFQKPAGLDVPAPATVPRPTSTGTGVPGAMPVRQSLPMPIAPTVPMTPMPTQPAPMGRTDVNPFSKENVFRLDSDSVLQDRIIQELLLEQPATKRENYKFPDAQPLVPPGTTYSPSTTGYVAMRALIEPGYVVHRRLYFEEKNSERYGWDLGITQPVVSTLAFYKDTLLWPSKLASNLFERYDTNAGKCLPGSPVPYYLYPPEVDILGGSAGAGLIVGAAFLFP